MVYIRRLIVPERKEHPDSHSKDMQSAISNAMLLLICGFSNFFVAIAQKNGNGSFTVCYKGQGEENIKEAKRIAGDNSVRVEEEVGVSIVNPLYKHAVRQGQALPQEQVAMISEFL